ncbi:MAG: glycosyltransferase family 4 protein [Planctomycetaceae bacterium]|nr:glycosyltransferase family 4 protein [Planctomycetaceae bacterium]
MHLLFLTDNFPPEVNAPASRTFEHCREWVRKGHRVTVITCAPNFPKGKVFDGYQNKAFQTETIEGIEVIRVWSYITANEGFVRRILDYLSFMASAIVASPRVHDVDLVIGTSPQFFTAVAAYVVSRMKRIPYVFELRDLWPESIKAVGAMKDSFAIRMLERLEMFLYRKAARIVSVTESFKQVLMRRGIECTKIEVVTNGVDVSQFKPRPKDPELTRKLGLEGKFVAGYIGTHGMAHALETLLQAADRLRGQNFAFIFLGDGARKQALREMADQMKLDNVVFIDSVPKADVPKYWSLLDVSIIHLRKTELFTTVIPSKLFECMGMGIPVLHGVEGESADIVRREQVGIPFEPEGVDQLCEALQSLKSDPARLARFREQCLRAAGNYDRTYLALRMLKVLEDAAARVPAAPMKVLLLNQVFWPDVAATAQHGHDLGRYLAQHGVQVTALASRSLYSETGKALPREGGVDGIRIVRAGQSRFGKTALAARAFDFVSFYLAALWRAIWLPRQDIVVCFTTPPFIAFVGILLRWLKGTKVVCWTMDLYPDVPVAAGVLRRGSLAHSLFDAVDRFSLRHADRVVVLGRCMQQRLLEKGVDPKRMEVINVWADGDEVSVRPIEGNALRTAWQVGDRFVIEYSGNFGIGHDGETMYRAMQATRADDSIRWVIVGGGTKRGELEAFVQAHDIVNAVLKPYQPREALGELLSLGNVHLVSVAENFSGLLVPSKFYGVLAAARPVLYVGPRESEVARVIEESKCGLVIEQGDSAGLVKAIETLHADPQLAQAMGRRAREVFERTFTRSHACERWLRLLQNV